MKASVTLILIATVFLTPAWAIARQDADYRPGASRIQPSGYGSIKLGYLPPGLLGKTKAIKAPDFKAEPKDKKTIRKIKRFLKKNDGKVRRKRQIFT